MEHHRLLKTAIARRRKDIKLVFHQKDSVLKNGIPSIYKCPLCVCLCLDNVQNYNMFYPNTINTMRNKYLFSFWDVLKGQLMKGVSLSPFSDPKQASGWWVLNTKRSVMLCLTPWYQPRTFNLWVRSLGLHIWLIHAYLPSPMGRTLKEDQWITEADPEWRVKLQALIFTPFL